MQKTVDLLKTESRTGSGSRAASALRKQGKTPAVIYGHGEGTASLCIDSIELTLALRSGHHVVTLDIDGAPQKALVKEVQFDPLGDRIVHVDFARISAHERVEVSVTVELIGQAPGIDAGGILNQNLHEILIACPADEIPEALKLNVSELELGQQLLVSDIPHPDNLEILHDAAETVVVIQRPTAEKEPELELGEAEPAQPEVIGRAAKEDEEPDEK